jgi:hypothetical protein
MAWCDALVPMYVRCLQAMSSDVAHRIYLRTLA